MLGLALIKNCRLFNDKIIIRDPNNVEEIVKIKKLVLNIFCVQKFIEIFGKKNKNAIKNNM